MYNVHTVMPSGARSIGYDHDKEEDAAAAHVRIAEQMRSLGMSGSSVVTEFAEIEVERTEI